MPNPDDARVQIHQAIQESTAQLDEDAVPDGSFCVGWVCIAEWVAPNGRRWLAKVDGNASGDPCTAWQVQGWLYNALNTSWPEMHDAW